MTEDENITTGIPTVEKAEIPLWNKVLCRDDLWKLYFENLGISDALSVERLTLLGDLVHLKNEERFRFAIVRNKILEKDDFKTSPFPIVNPKDIMSFILYPEDPKSYNDSINFLSLIISGFANLESTSNLIQKEEKDSSTNDNTKFNFQSFLSKLKTESVDANQHKLDEMFKNDEDFRTEHNRFANVTFSDRLDKIQNNNKTNFDYSLFFTKDNTLYEFRTDTDKLYEVALNVSENNVNQNLLDYIVSNNENRNRTHEFLHDVIIFNELTKAEEEEVTSNDMGEIIIIIVLTVLFIVNFFYAYPEDNFFQMKNALVKKLEHDTSGNSIVDTLSSLDEVQNYFKNTLLHGMYNGVLNINRFTLTDKSNEAAFNGTTAVANTTFFELPHTNYYFMNTNFFTGMMINFRQAEMETITDINGMQFHKRQITPGYQESPHVDRLTSFLSFDKASANPLYTNSFEVYFGPTMNANQIYMMNLQLNPIFDKTLYEFSYTFMLYNADYNILAAYSMQFNCNSYGKISYTRFFQGYLAYLSADRAFFLKMLIINILYLIIFLYFCFLVVRSFSKNIIELIVKSNYEFEWYEWVDLSVLVVCLGSQILFYLLFLFNPSMPDLTVVGKDDFISLFTVVYNTRNYQRFTGLSMVLMSLRLVRYLYTTYPNFGIVFQTIHNAYVEMLSFIVIVGLTLFAISMMAHNAFGWYSDAYETIDSSITTVYFMYLEIFNSDDLFNVYCSNPLAPIFFVVVLFFFNLILVNVFFCIVRNNYYEVKKNKQKSNEAYAMMAADETTELYLSISNLIFFRNPIECEKVAKLKLDSARGIINNNAAEKVNVEIIDEDSEQNKKKESINLFNTFMYHLDRLKFKEWFVGSKLNREEFIKRKKEKYRLIRKNNLLECLDQIDKNYEREFSQLGETVCYLIYIIIFIMMIFSQIRVGASNSSMDYLNLQVSDIVGEQTNFDSLDNVEIFYKQFFSYFYKPGPGGIDCTISPDTPKPLYQMINYYQFLNPPNFRITFRQLNFVEYTDPWEEFLFPVSLLDFRPLDINNCPSISDVTTPIIIHSSSSTFKMDYILPGNPIAADSCGGFVYWLQTNFPCNPVDISHDYELVSKYLFTDNIGSVILDFTLFSQFYDYAAYIKISTVRGLMGKVIYKLQTVYVPINRYVSLKDFNRLILELIYDFFLFYYFIVAVSEICVLIKKKLIQDYENETRNSKTFEESSLINKFLRFDIQKYSKDSGFSLVCKLFLDFNLLLLKRVTQLFFIFLKSIIDFLKEDYYNILDTISISISIIMFLKWREIINLTVNLNYNNSTEDMDESVIPYSNIVSMSLLSNLYSTYVKWQSINALFIFLRMLQYFKFSKSIYTLILVVKKASQTIFFHLVLLFIIFMGFVFWGFALFSQNSEYFRNVTMSVLTLMLLLSGQPQSLSQYKEADPLWASNFVNIFLLFFTSVLFNVLYSIIIESFEEMKHMQQQNMTEATQVNFIKNIAIIIHEKWKLFVTTLNLYCDNMYKCNQDYLSVCNKIYESSLEDTNADLNSAGNKGFFKAFKSFTMLKSSFFKAITNEISDLEQATLNGYCLIHFKERIKKKTDYEFNNTKGNVFDKEKLIVEPVTVGSDISIFMKIVIYIYLEVIEYKGKDFIKKTYLKKKNSFNFASEFKSNSNKINAFEKEIQTKHKNKEIKEKEEREKGQVKDVFLTEYLKSIKVMLDQKNLAFFKSNIFDKYFSYINSIKNSNFNNEENKVRNYRLSKETISYSTLVKHDQVYMIDSIERGLLYNTEPAIHQNESDHNPDDCYECEELRKYFNSVSTFIYDILIKNFYHPVEMNSNDKEIHSAYFLYLFQFNQTNIKEIKFLNKTIPNLKINSFENEIMFLRNNTDFAVIGIKDILYKKASIYINKKKEEEDEEEDKNLYNSILKEEFFDSKEHCDSFKELIRFYKLYTIWNSLYLILFGKYKSWTRKIRDKSHSNSFLSKNTKLGYKDLFIELYNLNARKLDDSLKEYQGMSFVEALLANSKKINLKHPEIIGNDFYDIGEVFFSDPNKYVLAEPNPWENKSSITPPKDKSSHKEEYYPQIFLKLWASFSLKEKFSLFFGYNSFIFSHLITKEMLFKADFYNKFNREFDSYGMMQAAHRAQLLSVLTVPAKFTEIIKVNIRVQIQKNIITDKTKINSVVTINDIFRYFNDMKLNYLVVHEIMENSFNTYLKKQKEDVWKTIKIFRSIFKVFNSQNKKEMEEPIKKIDFVKFFQLLQSKVKYDNQISYYDLNYKSNTNHFYENYNEEVNLGAKELIKKANENEEIEKMNVVDALNDNDVVLEMKNENLIYLKENEVFILALSLTPNDFLDAIRKIEDPSLKEFYLQLFYYVYGEDPEYLNYLNYLKRQLKILSIEKIEKYSHYMNDRGKVEKQIEEYEKEKNIGTSTQNYNEMMLNYINGISARKEQLINKALNIIESKTNIKKI